MQKSTNKYAKIIIALLFCTTLSCSIKTKEFSILPLHPYFKDNRLDTIIQRYRYFLVEGYDESQEQFDKMRNFCFENKDSNYGLYDGYEIVMYKETRKTNKEFRERPSDFIKWHGKDIIYTFGWSKGRYIGHLAWENGKVLNPKAKIKDIDN